MRSRSRGLRPPEPGRPDPGRPDPGRPDPRPALLRPKSHPKKASKREPCRVACGLCNKRAPSCLSSQRRSNDCPLPRGSRFRTTTPASSSPGVRGGSPNGAPTGTPWPLKRPRLPRPLLQCGHAGRERSGSGTTPAGGLVFTITRAEAEPDEDRRPFSRARGQRTISGCHTRSPSSARCVRS